MTATVSLFLDWKMPEEFQSTRSIKYKKGMSVMLNNPYDVKVDCWNEKQDSLLFWIKDDRVLSEIVKQSSNRLFAEILELAETENGEYKVTFLFKPNKLSKKYIIEENTTSEKRSFKVSVPASYDIVDFITDETEYLKLHKQTQHMRLAAAPFVIGRIIISDLESDRFRANFEDTLLYDYLEKRGQVEAYLTDIDIPTDYEVFLEFTIEKELNKPLTYKELKGNAPYDLDNSDLIIAACYTTPNGDRRYHNLSDGIIQSNIVGTAYIDDYEEFSDKIKISDKVILRKQAENPADKNAIAAYWNGKRIGYIPRINLPVVTLFMSNDEMNVKVCENNLGWVAIEFHINLSNIQKDVCQQKFGEIEFKIIKDSRSVKIDADQLLSIFKH